MPPSEPILPPKWIPELQKLPNFGQQLKDSEITFEWPKLADIQQLILTEPLRLTSVLTDFSRNSELNGIQLKFSNGIESPLFGQKSDSDKTTEKEITGRNIRQISTRTRLNDRHEFFSVEHESGSEVFFDG